MDNSKRRSQTVELAATETISSGPSLFVIQTHPLLIDTIISSLFTFVDYDTLKETRLVCGKWKAVCDRKFVKRSTFVLDKDKGTPKSFMKSPLDIRTIFSTIDREQVNFSSFKFNLSYMPSGIREMYLTPNVLTMTHLEISCEGVWDSGQVRKSNADELIGPNLIKLKLGSTFVTWTLSLSKLISIPKIELKNCKIIVDSGEKIKARELKLQDFELEKDPQRRTVTQMKDIIDFRPTLSKLELSCEISSFSPILNFSDCVNVKELSLASMNINLDGRISPDEFTIEDNRYTADGEEIPVVVLSNYIGSGSAHIRKMKLEHGPSEIGFDFRNCGTIDELQIYGCAVFRAMRLGTNVRKLKIDRAMYVHPDFVMDLSELPPAIESLELINPQQENFTTCTQPVSFLNLKHLNIRDDVNSFSHFQNCPSLVDLELSTSGVGKMKVLNVDELPQNLKRLSLKDIFEAEIIGSRNLKLELLVLSDLTDKEMYEILIYFFQTKISNKIQAGTVVFQWVENSDKNYEHANEMMIEKILTLKQNMSIPTVIVGKLLWGSEEIDENSKLFSLVDKKSEYYIIEGQKVRGIDLSEVTKLVPFGL